MKKNVIVTIYSVFLLDSLSTTSNITLAEHKVSVTADAQTSSIKLKLKELFMSEQDTTNK